MSFTLEVIDLEELSEPERDSEFSRIMEQESRRPFDLSKGPLFRALFLRLEAKNFILFFNMHHIISDGWSIEVLLREFEMLYRSFSLGESSSPAKTVTDNLSGSNPSHFFDVRKS